MLQRTSLRIFAVDMTTRFLAPFLPLVLAPAALSCLAASRCGMDFPEQPPSDLVIRMNSNGGMLPQWEEVTYSGDSIIVTRFFEGAESRLGTRGDMNIMARLWRIFLDNHFERISSYEEDVYDRGGITLSISHGGQTCEVSDAGRSLIARSDVARWERIVLAALAMRDSIVRRHGVPVSLIIDKAYDNHRVSFQIGWDMFLADSLIRVSADGLQITRRIVPGPQVLRANVDLEQWSEIRTNITSATSVRLILREGAPVIQQP